MAAAGGNGSAVVRPSRPDAATISMSFVDQTFAAGRTMQYLMVGRSLPVLVAGAGLGQMLHAFGEVRELHVGLHVLAPLRDRLFCYLSFLVGVRKALLDC